MEQEKILASLHFLCAQSAGVLSTHSVTDQGFPFGSLTPFAFDQDFQPIIQISDLAMHTKNIKDNNKYAWTLVDDTNLNAQTGMRVSLMATATRCEDQEAAGRWYHLKLNKAHSMASGHGFWFYRLCIHRLRVIQGFGKIYWLEKDHWTIKNFDYQQIEGAVTHLNDDHSDFLKRFSPDASEVKAIGLDPWGLTLSCDHKAKRVPFPSKVEQFEQIRHVLKDLSSSDDKGA